VPLFREVKGNIYRRLIFLSDSDSGDRQKLVKRRGNPNWVKGVTPPGAKPFLPGKTGNPRGSSRKVRITPILLEILDELADKDDPKSETNRHAVARALVEEAKARNVPAIKELMDRSDGKVGGEEPKETTVVNLLAILGQLPTGTLKELKEAFAKTASDE
jgi:uncharacterized protein DUF5681